MKKSPRGADDDICALGDVLFLGMKRRVAQPEKVVARDAVISTQPYQMPYRKLVCSALVACIHRLRRTEDIGYLLLSLIVILAQIAHPFDIVHLITVVIVSQYKYLLLTLVNICTKIMYEIIFA